MDIRLVQLHNAGRIECVTLIHGAICVRHIHRIDAAREIAFRRSYLHIFIIGVFRPNHLNCHQRIIADDCRYNHTRHIRLSGLCHRHHFIGFDNNCFTVWCHHDICIESINIDLNFNLIFS